MTDLHPVELYFNLLIAGHGDRIASLFSGEPLVFDPQHGEIRGATEFDGFAERYQAWLVSAAAQPVPVALTLTEKRAVAELVLNIEVHGKRLALPVAVVGDNTPANQPDAHAGPGRVLAIRVYHSMWPLSGRHRLRPPILPPDPNIRLSDTVAGYQRALAEGDLEKILDQFEEDGYFSEPSGGDYVYRGKGELRGLMSKIFSNGGGITLEHCSATDDGVRCAIEFNAVAWGKTALPPQAGVAVYERGASGKLSGARIYDDVSPPV